MRTVGIVAEYNPFHGGHKYHIETAKKQLLADAVIAVMSSGFVQRGEPAIFSKHSRAATALENGVDLVLELPVYYALKSAEGFCRGAVDILSATGVTDFLSFGSECGDIESLMEVSRILADEGEDFRDYLGENLKNGLSFAAAREEAIKKIMPEASNVIREPNNILGIEYLKAIIKSGSTITPHTIKRAGGGYNSDEPSGGYASATALRKMIREGRETLKYMPPPPDEAPLFIDDFEQMILYSVLTFPDIESVADTGDGLYERLVSARAGTLDELLGKTKTRRLTMARIKRVLMNIMIGNTLPSTLSPSYIRVLGMNKTGAQLLAKTKQSATLPVIIKPSNYDVCDPIWALECRATDIISIAKANPSGQNLTTSPVVID